MDVKIDCPCADRFHGPDGDTVTLRDTLDFRQAAAIRKSVAFAQSDDEGARALENLALLSEAYLLFGISSWTLVDGKHKAIPVSHSTIKDSLLALPLQSSVVADAADELYAEAVLLPLLARASTSSPPMPTADSISPTSGSMTKPPRQRKRSSISTTRTDDTGKIGASPNGGSY